MQYFAGLFYQSTPQACVVDLTPPTFSGISALVANANGSLSASWSAATDSSTPLKYSVFVQAGTATGLFNASNIVYSVLTATSTVIFTDAAGAPLVAGVTYFVGIRAVDAVGNVNTNTVSLSAISAGVPDNSITNKVDTLLARLTATRAGYLDNLPNLDATVSSRATQASISSIQNNTDFVGIVPPVLILPPSGSKLYVFYANLFSASATPIDPDSNTINVTIKDSSGATVVASTAMTRLGLGRYSIDYSVSSSDAERGLYVFFDYAKATIPYSQVRVTEVQEFESKLDTLISRLTPTRAANLDNLDATISSREAESAAVSRYNDINSDVAAVKADTSTLITDVASVKSDTAGLRTDYTTLRAAKLDNLDATVSSRESESVAATRQTAVVTLLVDIQGAGFVSSNDSLHQIRGGVTASVDLTPVITRLDDIKGTGFVTTEDSLKDLNDTAKTEREKISQDTEALLSSGVAV